MFGTDKPDDIFKADTVYRNFDVFHKYFNFLWLGLPVELFPEACRALETLIQQPSSAEILSREDVSLFVKYMLQHMKSYGQTESDMIGYNLVYLHANYNTFRVIFWFIYTLMTHPEAQKALSLKVNDVIERKAEYHDKDEMIQFDMEELDTLPILGNYDFLIFLNLNNMNK